MNSVDPMAKALIAKANNVKLARCFWFIFHTPTLFIDVVYYSIEVVTAQLRTFLLLGYSKVIIGYYHNEKVNQN